jgi:hypothetical protein
MARRAFLINLVLFAGVLLASYRLYIDWRAFEQNRNLARILQEAETASPAPPHSALVLEREVPLHDFWVIGERNLFDPDRGRGEPAETQAAEEKPPEFPKEPLLQGITETDEGKRAYVIVFDNPRSQGDLRTIAPGDNLQGYTVAEITDSAVILRWKEVSRVIDLFGGDSQPPPAGGGQRTASVNIIRIGSQQTAVETSSAPENVVGEAGGGRVGNVMRPTGGTSATAGGGRSPRDLMRGARGTSAPAGPVTVAPATGLVGAPGMTGRPPEEQ